MQATGQLASQHILLVAEYYPSGGTRTYVRQLLDFYATHGAHVTLVTTLPDGDPEMKAHVESYGFRVLTFADVMGFTGTEKETRRPTVWSWREWRRERAAFRDLAAQLEVDRVVVSSGNPGMLLSAAWASPRTIFVAHGYPHGRRQERLARAYLWRLIPRGTSFIAVSEFQARIMRHLWRTEERGCTVETVLSTYGEPAPNHSSVSPPWHVLTASLIEDYKQPFDWIEVADRVISRMPPGSVQFTWVGDGSLLRQAQETAVSKANSAHIAFPGVSADPSPQYLECRVYLQLSSIENMSLAVIDAQRHGVPCVVTNVGGLPEIIEAGVNGIVIPARDVDAAVEAISRLLSNGDLWESMSVGAQQLYGERHSYRAWESSMLQLHGNLA